LKTYKTNWPRETGNTGINTLGKISDTWMGVETITRTGETDQGVTRLGPNEFISIDGFPYMNCNSVESLKLLHVAFIFLLGKLIHRVNDL
jgi:hypothetical protein